MNFKTYLYFFLALTLIFPMLSAAEETLGVFKQGTCINLLQSCSNCTYNNITSVIAPNSDTALTEVEMTRTGTLYNYNFCSTSQIGKYIVNGFGNDDGIISTWTYDFEITPSGYKNSLGFYFVVIALLGAVIILGFSIKDEWFVIFGGMGLIVLGIYSINNGIAGFRDMFLTWTVALFEIGTGAYLAIQSALMMMDIELGIGGSS